MGRLAAAAHTLGRAGEAAVGIAGNTQRVASATGTAAYRIPATLNFVSKVIGEVKNVRSLSYTDQLRDFAAYARADPGRTLSCTCDRRLSCPARCRRPTSLLVATRYVSHGRTFWPCLAREIDLARGRKSAVAKYRRQSLTHRVLELTADPV